MTAAIGMIAESVEHDCIVTVDHTPELHDELLILCDDYVENRPVFEFWGEADGNEWRIHLRVRDDVAEDE